MVSSSEGTAGAEAAWDLATQEGETDWEEVEVREVLQVAAVVSREVRERGEVKWARSK